jgi:glycerol uptake facilitator-like aquaporin
VAGDINSTTPVLYNAPQGVNLSQAFGWEVMMTFLLVVTIYSVAVGEPSFGNMGPLAIGLALFAAAITGELS